MRHVQGSDMRQSLLVISGEVSVSVFCSLSWSFFARSVLAHTDRSESSRGCLSGNTLHPCYTWQHPTIDVTGCGVETSCVKRGQRNVEEYC